MNAYDSTPFNIKAGTQPAGSQAMVGGAVYLPPSQMVPNGQLVYAFRIQGLLHYLTCTPPSGQDALTVVAPPANNWNNCWKFVKTTCIIQPFDYMLFPCLTIPTVAFSNPNGYQDIYFLTGSMGEVLTAYRLNGIDQSIDVIPLNSANLQSPGIMTCSAGATAWGNYLLVGWWNEGANELTWDAYDVSSPPLASTPWNPVSESGGVPGSFQLTDGDPLPPNAFGPVASMDWFTVGGNFYLVTSFVQVPNYVPNIMVNQMVTTDSSGNLYPLPFTTNNVYPTIFQTVLSPGNPVTVARDPAGRMTLCGCDNSQQVMLSVPSVTDPFPGPTTPLSPSPWLPLPTTWPALCAESTPSSQTAVTTWGYGPGYTYSYPPGSPAPNTSTRQDIYQISVYGNSKTNITCEIQSFGIAEVVSTSTTTPAGTLLPNGPTQPGSVQPGTAYTGVVSGIFDAPFPLPLSNILNNKAAGTLGALTCNVTYGTTQATGTSRSVDFSVGGGFSSQGTTVAGMGPAWSVSVTKETSSNTGSDAYQSSLSQAVMYTSLAADGASIESNGAALADNVVYLGTAYRILDVSGNPLPNDESPVICTIIPTLQDAPAYDLFTPYLVVPVVPPAGSYPEGTPAQFDLASYTRDNINAQAILLNLFQGTESDYIRDVIEPNCLPFANGMLYLEWTQNANFQFNQTSLSSSDTWTETGWNLNASLYYGISQGAAFSVAGVTFASFQIETLGGVNLSASHSTTTTTTEQIQITPDVILPPSTGADTDVTALTVRIYFLPANARWIWELQQVQQNTTWAQNNATLNVADWNSSPWRLFFLVSSYEQVNGYVYLDPGDSAG